jgi:hypothetical protein
VIENVLKTKFKASASKEMDKFLRGEGLGWGEIEMIA